MPFTLSHPALVLPLRRTGLPMAGLVCGSMAPDLHMLVPGVSDEATHAWSGVPTIDVVLGGALTVAWVLVLSPAAYAAAPRVVRERLRPAPRYEPATWALGMLAVVVGAATHVAWDSFTHESMWGGQHLAWLREAHHGHPGYQWAQYLSSVVGLLVLAAWGLLLLRRRRPKSIAPDPRAQSARLALGSPVVLGSVLGGFAFVYVAGTWDAIDIALAAGMRLLLVVSAAGAGLGAVVWRLVGLLSGSGGRHAHPDA